MPSNIYPLLLFVEYVKRDLGLQEVAVVLRAHDPNNVIDISLIYNSFKVDALFDLLNGGTDIKLCQVVHPDHIPELSQIRLAEVLPADHSLTHVHFEISPPLKS